MNDDIYKIETCRNVCIEMLTQRNYEIIDNTKTDTIHAIKPDKSPVIVFLIQDKIKFNANSMLLYLSKMNDEKIRHSIIVLKEGITSPTKKSLEQFTDIYIEIFSELELQYNITKHRLQPRFERLSTDEAYEFKKKHGIKSYGTIKVSDPVSRFYNYNAGDVIRIIRKSGYITYRIVR
jgi:DNA-directed RNA polymerase I, II, and III subunit RPABC1